MKKMKISIFSLVLFLVTAAILAYSIWGFVEATGQLRAMAEAGQDLSGQNFQIVGFYFTTWGEPLLYAIFLAALAWLLQRQKLIALAVAASKESLPKEASDSLYAAEITDGWKNESVDIDREETASDDAVSDDDSLKS
jgi:hypothetical protein